MADKIRKLVHTAAELDTAVDMLLEVYTRDEVDNIVTQKVSSETLSRQETDSRLTAETALNRSTLGYTRKNLLKNTAASQTKNGVTFTVNADGTVTVSGTNTGTSTVYVTLNSGVETSLGQKYTASIGDTETLGVYMSLFDTSWAGVGKCSTSVTFIEDKNSGRNIRLSVESGITVENVTFYPMLRLADIADDTYEPYKPSVEERLAALEAALAAAESGA